MAATLTVDLNARIAQFETEMKRATGTLDKFGKRGDAVAAGFKSAFGGLAAALSVGALASFAKSGIDAADSLNDMSQRLGVTVKDLASFKLAAEQSGTSLDSVGAGIARLSRSIGEAENGNKKLAETLGKLGVSAKDPKEAFFQLADAVQRIQDPTQRAALLSDVLGKSYGELVPLLNQGSEALRKSASESESFADAMARLAPEADKFNDQMALLKSNAAGLTASILSQLVPALNTLLDRFGNIRAAIGAGGLFAGAGLSGTLSNDLPKINKEVLQLEQTIARLKKNSGGLDSSIAPLTNQLNNLKKVQAALQGRQAGVVSDLMRPPKSKATALLGDFTAPVKSSGSRAPAAAKAKTDFDDLAAATKAATEELEKYYETERMVAEFDIDRDNELAAIAESWREAGRAIEEEFKPGLEKLEDRLEYLNELFRRGVISVDALSAATADAFDTIGKDGAKALEKPISELDEFAKSAAQNMQSSFADFLFDPFDEGMDGMLKSFGQTIQRMVAEAASAQIIEALFGKDGSAISNLLGGGGGGSNLFGDLFDSISSSFSDLFSGFGGGGFSSGGWDLGFSFAGGGYTGSGPRTGGIDGMGGFPAILHPNETVLDHTKGQGMGGQTIIVHVNGSNNAPDVRRAAGQGAREALGLLSGAKRYA